jgi:hypothetical protein
LLVSAASLEVGKLADRYTSDALGEIGIHRQGAAAVFDFGEWKSSLASRKNDDGTISFFPADRGPELQASPGGPCPALVEGRLFTRRPLVAADTRNEIPSFRRAEAACRAGSDVAEIRGLS